MWRKKIIMIRNTKGISKKKGKENGVFVFVIAVVNRALEGKYVSVSAACTFCPLKIHVHCTCRVFLMGLGHQ